MNNPTCDKCDCVAECQSRARLCPNLAAQADGTLADEGTKAPIAQPEHKPRTESEIVALAYTLSDSRYCSNRIGKVAFNYDQLQAFVTAIAQPEQLAPRGTDAQILKEREITTSAVVGAMAYGYQNGEYPPDDSVWLRPFWEMGRRDAEREALIAQPEQPEAQE